MTSDAAYKIGRVLKIVFTGCLLIGIADNCFTTACGDRPLIGIIRTIEF